MQINDVKKFPEFCLYIPVVSLGVEIESNFVVTYRHNKKEITVERYEFRILCVAVPVTSLRL